MSRLLLLFALLATACAPAAAPDGVAVAAAAPVGSAVAAKADGAGADVPYGGVEPARWNTEAVLANAARRALAGAPSDALVSVPTRLYVTDLRPFGDGQSNAIARMEHWAAPRPPIVATLLPAAGEVRFLVDRAVPTAASALVIDFGMTPDHPAPTGSVTLPWTVDAAGDRHAVWSLPPEVDFADAVSEARALVRPADWADAFPLRFRFPRRSVDAMVDSVPPHQRHTADGVALPDPARVAGAAAARLGAGVAGYAGPFRNESVHAGAGDAVTAVGGARAWVRQDPFKQLYLCLDPRDLAAEAAAGAPSGAGWHAIGDPAETLLNTVEGGALLAGWAADAPVSGAMLDAAGAGLAYGLREVATFGWLRPGEALVTAKRDARDAYHWFAADHAPRCVEVWVHDCRPGADMTFACGGRDVRFEAVVDTAWGESARLVGDHPALGAWDPARGVPMDPAAWPVWSAHVELPAGETVRFKVVRVAADGAVTWPAGPDATFTVPSTGAAVARVE